jgi:hypothetical protein
MMLRYELGDLVAVNPYWTFGIDGDWRIANVLRHDWYQITLQETAHNPVNVVFKLHAANLRPRPQIITLLFHEYPVFVDYE